jgi:hypothetical protein
VLQMAAVFLAPDDSRAMTDPTLAVDGERTAL